MELMIPSDPTERTLLPSATTKLPNESPASTEEGWFSVASVARFPSPAEPNAPVPATVRIVPSTPMRRTLFAEGSVT